MSSVGYFWTEDGAISVPVRIYGSKKEIYLDPFVHIFSSQSSQKPHRVTVIQLYKNEAKHNLLQAVSKALKSRVL